MFAKGYARGLFCLICAILAPKLANFGEFWFLEKDDSKYRYESMGCVEKPKFGKLLYINNIGQI